jgi:hypothetical protein
MANCGSVTQVHQSNQYGPLPLQLWKATITIPAASTGITVTAPLKMSGTAVEAWIDPTTLTASATIKVYDATDALTTPLYVVNYTVPTPAVETHSALSARYRVMGTLTCVVASATAGDVFDLYVMVDPNADDVEMNDISVDIDSDSITALATALGAATEGDALGEGILIQGDDGTDRTNVLVDTTGHLLVTAAGDIAHDAADSGNPVKIGAKAISATPTAVVANDRTDLYADLYGQLRVNTTQINMWTAYHDFTDTTAAHEVKAADGALSHYVTDIIVTNDATLAMTMYICTDTAGGATQLTGTFKVPASGGFVLNLRTPIKGTAAKNIGVVSTGTTNWSITMCGYTAA